MTEAEPHMSLVSPNETRNVDVSLRTPANTDMRALTYAVFSRLTASPFEQTDEQLNMLFDGELSGALQDANGQLPFDLDLLALAEAADQFTKDDLPLLRRSYSSKFEVGNDGPPVPLRAELVRSQETKLKEELVRFYDFFSYKLNDDIAWSPDHLSIMLEFMQLLCLKEKDAKSDDAVVSLTLAQLDFLDRHVVSWVPVCVGRLLQSHREDFFTKVMTTLWEFLEQDRAWIASAVTETEGER